MRPVSVSKSASSHAGIAETVSVAPRASGSTGLVVRRATTWPSSTREGGDGHEAAVDQHVAARHELAGLCPRRREPEPVDDVVEPALEAGEELVAHPLLALARRLAHVAPELALADAVVALRPLLLAQLQRVDRRPRLAALAVLAGRGGAAALDAGLAQQHPLTLEVQLDALAPGELLDRSGVASH
jgi:hypothetical protein